MRNPLYDWIGVAVSFFIALIITLVAKRIADQRIDEWLKLKTTITVTDASQIEVGKEIQIGGTRMIVVSIKGNTLSVIPKRE